MVKIAKWKRRETWWKSPEPEPAELPEVLLTRTGTFSMILRSFTSRSSSSSLSMGPLFVHSTIAPPRPPPAPASASIAAPVFGATATSWRSLPLPSPSLDGPDIAASKMEEPETLVERRGSTKYDESKYIKNPVKKREGDPTRSSSWDAIERCRVARGRRLSATARRSGGDGVRSGRIRVKGREMPRRSARGSGLGFFFARIKVRFRKWPDRRGPVRVGPVVVLCFPEVVHIYIFYKLKIT